MFELQEQNPLSSLKQLSPAHRFGKVAEITIEKNHSLSLTAKQDSIKILSWNIAKNNRDLEEIRFAGHAVAAKADRNKIFLRSLEMSFIFLSNGYNPYTNSF